MFPQEMIAADLRGEIEVLLNALRQWIIALETSAQEEAVDLARDPLPEADLHSVVAELTALRGEVRVESRVAKASRESMERAADSFEQGLAGARGAIQETTSVLESGWRQSLAPLVRERDQLRQDLEKAREEPLARGLEALLDVEEALRRGQQATEKARRRLRWRSWFLPRGLFGGLLDGYDMARRRVERSLRALDVDEIPCLGCEFDPRHMRSVESEARDDVPPGLVLEVIRPGYRRGEKILRYADVRIAAASKRQPEEGGDASGQRRSE